MHYKHLLVYLDNGASNPARVQLALSLAKAHDARLTGIVVNELPSEGLLRNLGLGDGKSAIGQARAAANTVHEAFRSACADAQVVCDTRLLECKEGRAGEKLARIARLYDLCVVRQANPERPHAAQVSAMSEEVMLSSGRPVICVPYIGAHEVPFKTSVIAWDGSRAATRAVHDALPVLAQIDHINILVVNPANFENFSDHAPGDGLQSLLATHGIDARVSRIDAGDISTSTVILNHLSDTGADILVMGGYGTPRLREILLGGVTHTLFKHMTVPVFLSH
ncbi:MAG: universal stress protein [Pseudomonadota bacterium]